MHALPVYPWAFDDPAWTADGIALDELSLYDWIETRIPGGHSSRLGQFIDVAYVIELGEDTPRQGATDLLGLLGFPAKGPWWVYGASDERWKIVGGNQQLSLAQADYLGAANIRLGWSLTALARNGDGSVTATFDVGGHTKTVRADEIVLALPLGVMKRIAAGGGFDAGVRRRRAQARLDRRARLRREQQAPAPDRRPLLGRQGPVGQLERRVVRRHRLPGGVARDRRTAGHDRDRRRLHGRRHLAVAQPVEGLERHERPERGGAQRTSATRRARSSPRSSRSSPA